MDSLANRYVGRNGRARSIGSIFVLLLSTCISICGCASHAKRIAAPRQAFYSNELNSSIEQFTKLANKRGDKDCVELDLAIAELTSGNPAACEQRLRKVRDRFDHLEQKSLTESATSYWTDDRVRAYAGEEYERVLIRAFLALSNLMNDGIDAEAYTLQLDEKQRDIYEAAYQRLGDEKIQQYPVTPFGFYLRGMLRESSGHDYDEATLNYTRVCELSPNTRSFTHDLNRATHGTHSAPGMGVLYVFAMVGQGPQKIAVTEEPTSAAIAISGGIISAVGPYQLPPTIAPIQIPGIELTQSATDQVLVSVDQTSIGPTDTIADIEQLAMQTYELNKNEILARAIARRVIKKATVAATTDAVDVDPMVSFAMMLAGSAWEATEVADTRCWSLLPASIQVIRIEMPQGKHRIGIRSMQAGYAFGSEHVSEVDITQGHNTYMLANIPDDRVIGQVLVSR
jgi:uncharacterized protein